MNKWEYIKYLESEHWQGVRARALNRADDACQECGSEVDLHVHHLNYENIGNEKDTDLVVICEVCHIKHHDTAKVKEKYE